MPRLKKKKIIERLRNTWHYLRYKQIKKLIANEGKELLDIGCGRPFHAMEDGAFLNYIGYGNGLDIKDCKLEFPFKKGNSNNIPFKDNSFDVVVALETLEHVSDLKQTFKEIKRVLKPKGIFLLSTPNNSFLWISIWFLWEKTFGKEWLKTHKAKYNKTQWVGLLSKYFKIEEITHFLWLLLIVKIRNIK